MFDWMDEKIHRLKWFDIGILKLCVASFILLVAKAWNPILSLSWHWYASVFVISYIYLIYRVYLKK